MKMIEEVNEIRDFLNHPSINLTAVIVGLRNGQTLYWDHVRAHSQVLCLHCIFEGLADRDNLLFK